MKPSWCGDGFTSSSTQILPFSMKWCIPGRGAPQPCKEAVKGAGRPPLGAQPYLFCPGSAAGSPPVSFPWLAFIPSSKFASFQQFLSSYLHPKPLPPPPSSSPPPPHTAPPAPPFSTPPLHAPFHSLSLSLSLARAFRVVLSLPLSLSFFHYLASALVSLSSPNRQRAQLPWASKF